MVEQARWVEATLCACGWHRLGSRSIAVCPRCGDKPNDFARALRAREVYPGRWWKPWVTYGPWHTIEILDTPPPKEGNHDS